MRFLIDENLSPRLVVAVGDLFPGSVHVETLGMRGGTDAAVWTVARDRGFAILTKDEDFSGMSVLYGAAEGHPLAVGQRRHAGGCRSPH